MRKTFLGALGFLLVSAQMQAQTETDSIGTTHELKDVVVKATNGYQPLAHLLIFSAFDNSRPYRRKRFFGCYFMIFFDWEVPSVNWVTSMLKPLNGTALSCPCKS